MKNAALFIVDVQNDFLPGGALAVKNGDEILEPVNRLMEKFDRVLASKDWHPADTVHFEKWPVHCVRGTQGAAFPERLHLNKINKVFLKGTGNTDDGYSAFEATNEDLESYLKINGITKLYVVGLATDYCVKATAIDAARKGFETYVVREAVRAVNLQPTDEAGAIKQMEQAGVKIISENEI
jgi:nicotinamidase/pyrazinamidase